MRKCNNCKEYAKCKQKWYFEKLKILTCPDFKLKRVIQHTAKN